MKSNGPMSGAQGRINAAAGERPSRVAKSRVNTGSVGKETPVSPKVVQEGGSAAEAGGTRNQLHGATKELYEQHPHDYSSHGPHHGTRDHIRHVPHVKPNPGHPYGR